MAKELEVATPKPVAVLTIEVFGVTEFLVKTSGETTQVTVRLMERAMQALQQKISMDKRLLFAKNSKKFEEQRNLDMATVSGALLNG